jgi:hypothetical protein
MPLIKGDQIVVRNERGVQPGTILDAPDVEHFTVQLEDGTVLQRVPDHQVSLRPDRMIQLLLKNLDDVTDESRSRAAELTSRARGQWTDAELDRLGDGRRRTSRTAAAQIEAWNAADRIVRDCAREIQAGDVPNPQAIRVLIDRLHIALVGEGAHKFRDDRDSRGAAVLPVDMIETTLAQFCDWYSRTFRSANSILVAAQAYCYLNGIHPFTDGNGRTCQMLMDLVLLGNGLPPASLQSMMVVPAIADSLPTTGELVRVILGVESSLAVLSATPATSSTSTTSTSTSPTAGLWEQIRSRRVPDPPDSPPSDDVDK